MKEHNNDDYFKKQKPSILRSIGGLLTFTTIIPLNVYTTIDEMAKMTWFWPVINAFVGLIGAIIAYLLMGIIHFDPLLVACIVYGFLIMINGFNHLDGLMDFGDGIMVHGTPEKKLNIMKDPMTGVGGIATGFVVGTITIAALSSILNFANLNSIYGILMIAIGEMSAKVGLITCCISSKPSPEGIGKYFIKYINIANYIVGIIIALIIAIILSWQFGAILGIAGVLGGIFGGALCSLLAKKHLKIANGDVLGSSNELGRLFSLLFMITVFSIAVI
ncbi:adenosylcobinamide-GDP ribazoletransferase [uncultured Methanobrevibacter sp.]|uniref:adenosylcobinamide-GDP ribazoletransferase n=1 Tax=uncultured Methanobrevibacter sp. TaxID=253161 RepID=UPI002639F7C0